jgi:hypothetical protein
MPRSLAMPQAQDGLGWRAARLCMNPDKGAHVELYAVGNAAS